MNGKRIALAGLLAFIIAGTAPFALGQGYGTDTQNVLMPASGGMAGVSIARPQDVPAAIFGNPATPLAVPGDAVHPRRRVGRRLSDRHRTTARSTNLRTAVQRHLADAGLRHARHRRDPGLARRSAFPARWASASPASAAWAPSIAAACPRTAAAQQRQQRVHGARRQRRRGRRSDRPTLRRRERDPRHRLRATGTCRPAGQHARWSTTTPCAAPSALDYDAERLQHRRRVTIRRRWASTSPTPSASGDDVPRPPHRPAGDHRPRLGQPQPDGRQPADSPPTSITSSGKTPRSGRTCMVNQWAFAVGAQLTRGQTQIPPGLLVQRPTPSTTTSATALDGISRSPRPNCSCSRRRARRRSTSTASPAASGLSDFLVPNLDLDLFAGGLFQAEDQFGANSVSVAIYYVGLGMTWKYGPCGEPGQCE